MNPENQLSRWGAIARALPPTFGNIFFVVNTANSWVGDLLSEFPPDRNGQVRVFGSLAEAYAACVSGRNDYIFLDGNSSHTVVPFVWSKSRINVVGLGELRSAQQGAKVQNVAADTAAYVLQITGIRNTFKNVKFIQNSTQATALTVIQDGGEGTHWDHSSFTFGVATNLGLTTAHEFLAGSDTSTYDDCTFGEDTLLTSAARSVFHIDQVNGFEFKSNQLNRCKFIMSSSSSTATFIRLDAVGDILFTNLFEDCTFVASVDSAGGAAIAEAVQTGTGTVKGGLYFVRPAVFNVTDFATATSGRNANVQVVAAVSVAAAIEGIKPTA